MTKDYKESIDSNLVSKGPRGSSMNRLRRDLFGLPLGLQTKLEHLRGQNCWLLGMTMLNCFDHKSLLPIWSYQRVDLKRRTRVRKSEKLRQSLRCIKVREGLTRGHLSTMSFCINDQDARASCNYRNIVAQTERQNNWNCKMWEEDLQKRLLTVKFIAHITTVLVYKDGADKHQHSMFKILFEEHVGQPLRLKCYLIYNSSVYDGDDKSPPYKIISLAEVQKRTQMNFLNSYTIKKLKLNNDRLR